MPKMASGPFQDGFAAMQHTKPLHGAAIRSRRRTTTQRLAIPKRTQYGAHSALRARGSPMKLIAQLCVLVLLIVDAGLARAQLAGHGGPVRSIAISADGKTLLSGSFDTAAIRWSLAGGSAEQVLRFHSDAVNAVVFLRDGRMATAGGDAKIALWTAGRQQPDDVLEGHTAPIVALAVSPDGATLASASWDSTARLWPLGPDAKRVLEGHAQNVK